MPTRKNDKKTQHIYNHCLQFTKTHRAGYEFCIQPTSVSLMAFSLECDYDFARTEKWETRSWRKASTVGARGSKKEKRYVYKNQYYET